MHKKILVTILLASGLHDYRIQIKLLLGLQIFSSSVCLDSTQGPCSLLASVYPGLYRREESNEIVWIINSVLRHERLRKTGALTPEGDQR